MARKWTKTDEIELTIAMLVTIATAYLSFDWRTVSRVLFVIWGAEYLYRSFQKHSSKHQGPSIVAETTR